MRSILMSGSERAIRIVECEWSVVETEGVG